MNISLIDLRSDTATLPTEEMREAMGLAEVGDDSKGEDPSVNKLQDTACEMLGKEAALFVPSGTMGNLVALMVYTQPGDEIIVESDAHIYGYEHRGYAKVALLSCRCLMGTDGIMDPAEVEMAIRNADQTAQTALVCVENTHTYQGGVVVPAKDLGILASVAHQRQVPVHLDGARLFNAAVASDLDIKEFTKHVDSVMVCLSKGLGAPVGSLLLGTKEFTKEAREVRKMLGGGMRQAGIVAAAGTVALTTMVDRLKEDHFNAKWLAEHINSIGGLSIDLRLVQTNILYINLDCSSFTAEQFAGLLQQRGILVSIFGERVRMVTHRDICKKDVEHVFKSCKSIAEGG